MVNTYYRHGYWGLEGVIMKTKELLKKTGISEPTLRRWLRDGHPIPELLKVPRDWTGRRDWSEEHVKLILDYKKHRLELFN